MKKILLILLLLNISIYAEKMSAESCVGLTDKIIEFHTDNKKIDTINNLTVLCDSGCGKACVESSMIKSGTTNIMDLKDKSLAIGCDAKFPYGKACYMRKWTDRKNSQSYIEKGCKYGYSQACNTLAGNYKSNKDYPNFIKYAKIGCNMGDIESCLILATQYADGRSGVNKDLKQAVAFYEKAANFGSAGGQYNLGISYMNGRGVERNYKKAKDFFHKAAKQGELDAIYNIGYMFENGLGIKKDSKQAFVFYKKAADKGHSQAQYIVGIKYYMGNGIQKDKIKAYQYWMKAAKQGITGAQNNLDILCKESPWACK